MTGALATFALFLAFFVLQTSVLATGFLWLSRATDLPLLSGQTIDLALLLLVYLGLHRDRSGTMIWSVLAGLLAAGFGLAWKGAASLGFLVAGAICVIARKGILLEGAGAMALLAAFVTFAEGLVHVGVGRVLSGVSEPVTAYLGPLLLRSALHALAAPPLFVLFRRLDRFGGASVERNPRSLAMNL